MEAISNVKEFSGEGIPIRDLISNKEISDKAKVLQYLNSFEPDCAAGMSLRDEITGEPVNSGVNGYEDEGFYWDTREIYHFEKYNLRLSGKFVSHVLSK